MVLCQLHLIIWQYMRMETSEDGLNAYHPHNLRMICLSPSLLDVQLGIHEWCFLWLWETPLCCTGRCWLDSQVGLQAFPGPKSISTRYNNSIIHVTASQNSSQGTTTSQWLVTCTVYVQVTWCFKKKSDATRETSCRGTNSSVATPHSKTNASNHPGISWIQVAY